MSEVSLTVAGRRYLGWKSIRVVRTIESLSGSFDLEVSDRWAGQPNPWPIAEEDACRVEIDGVTVIDGYVDHRSLSISASSRSLSYSGRDRAAQLVDCSAVLKSWTFRGSNVLQMAQKLVEPFGIKVSLQPGLTPAMLEPRAKKKKEVVQPGDSVHTALHKLASVAAVLIVSDGAGGIMITRGGTQRISSALVEGQNVLSASLDYDATERYHRYIVVSQVASTAYAKDDDDGEDDDSDGGDDVPIAASSVRAEAIDSGVLRKERVLVIRPDKGLTAAYAQQRADWEARVRAAKCETASVTVQGWKQPGGDLWPINRLVPVRIPTIGVDGDMLISEVEHSLGGDGETTRLKLVRPDAFTPAPHDKGGVGGTGAWKELANGAKPEKVKPQR